MTSSLRIQNLWMAQLLGLSDAFHLSLYIFINNYIWPKSCFWWCFLPKVVWCLAFLVVFPAELSDLLGLLLVSSIGNLLHIVCSEEAMVNFKDKNQGSCLEAYSLTQNNVIYMIRVVQVILMPAPPR